MDIKYSQCTGCFVICHTEGNNTIALLDNDTYQHIKLWTAFDIQDAKNDEEIGRLMFYCLD